MKNYKTFYENTIIENIDLEPYGLKNDVYLYDKIKTMYNIFKEEYVHKNNEHLSEIRLFEDYLRGLPTCLTVPFYNYEILENAKKYGFNIPCENKEDEFLEYYWRRLSTAFFRLKDNL